MSKYYEWKKGETIQFTPHFSSAEFECPCHNIDCIDQKISVELVDRLERGRQNYGKGVKITSGYRCKKHNAEVGGVAGSQHLDGDAADSVPVEHTTDSMDNWINAIIPQFQSYGIASNFIHTDTREAHADGSKRIWYYAS